MKADKVRKTSNRVRELVEDALGVQDTRALDESIKCGKAMRKRIPREEHAMWDPPQDRPDPVALLREQGASRVQELLPLRYERMSASAFTFYRGAALIMASDLSHTPTTGIDVQACGDAHISNFGLFNSPEQRTVFDINDFDETSRGPWEWDVKRLVASVEICGRDRGFSKKDRKVMVRSCAAAYRLGMYDFARMGHLDTWYAHLDVDRIMERFSDKFDEKTRKRLTKTLKKAKNKNSVRAVSKLTETVDGKLRIVSQPPTIVPLRDFAEEFGTTDTLDAIGIERIVRLALSEYRQTLRLEHRRLISQYHGVDIGIKVVGVGSVGTRAFIVVLEGTGTNDPLVLQIKEAEESVLERFCGKSEFSLHGRRVVEGQRAMQSTSDFLLGWCQLPDARGGMKDYYVRQLWNGKGSIDLSKPEPDYLAYYAQLCGFTLAHAHARTGNRFEISGYLGKSKAFDKAMWKFARAYADQNQRDYDRFMEALEAGEL